MRSACPYCSNARLQSCAHAARHSSALVCSFQSVAGMALHLYCRFWSHRFSFPAGQECTPSSASLPMRRPCECSRGFPPSFVPRGTKRRLQDRTYHIHMVYKCALAEGRGRDASPLPSRPAPFRLPSAPHSYAEWVFLVAVCFLPKQER